MTEQEIIDGLDGAETYPGSHELNWREVSFKTLAAWVALHPQRTVLKTEDFDVESVKGMVESWWKDRQKSTSAS
jgi:hypothetical protein